MTKNFSDGYVSIFTLKEGFSTLIFFLRILGLVEVLENVIRVLKERSYLKKKHYLRKDLDFKISKTKPIIKEPSLVSTVTDPILTKF